MRYSEIKKLVQILHRHGYELIPKVGIYQKRYSLGDSHYGNQVGKMAIKEYKGDMEKVLLYLDRKAYLKLSEQK